MTIRKRPKIILGSRSPRRRELLQLVVPAERIEVVPPLSADEPGFDDVHDEPGIEQRLISIARDKCDDVLEQLGTRQAGFDAVVTADTVIVAHSRDDRLIVLGQPPDDGTYADTLRQWFRDYYFGRTHTVATALCVTTADGRKAERVARSQVTFDTGGEKLLEWYIAGGEPRGKAGGYAIQGAGSLFVSGVTDSLSNVVGLPLRELVDALTEVGIEQVFCHGDTETRRSARKG